MIKRMHLIYAGCPICGGDCNYIPGQPDKTGKQAVDGWECENCHKRFKTPNFAIVPGFTGIVAVKCGRVLGEA